MNVARELKEYGYTSTFVVLKRKDKIAAETDVEVIVSKGITKFEDIKVNKVLPSIVNDSFYGESLTLSMI